MSKIKSKKKKAKRKNYLPLSKKDKIFYTVFEVVSAIFLLTIFYAYEPVTGHFILKNENVLAFQERWTMLLIAPFLLIYFLLICYFLTDRIPIFGNEKIDYYKTNNCKFVFPLFDKRYKNIESFKKHRNKFFLKLTVCIFVLVILFTVSVLGCVGRHEFGYNSIKTYSIFNNVLSEYSYDEVKSYSISAVEHHHVRRGLSYIKSDIYLIIELNNGDNYTASYTTSRDIYALKEIDALLSRNMKSINSQYLDDFINRHNFTADELNVIYKLFEA